MQRRLSFSELNDATLEHILVGPETYNRVVRERFAAGGITVKTWLGLLEEVQCAWERQRQAKQLLQADLEFWKNESGVTVVLKDWGQRRPGPALLWLILEARCAAGISRTCVHLTTPLANLGCGGFPGYDPNVCLSSPLFPHCSRAFPTRNWAGRGRLFLISTFSLPVRWRETKTVQPLKEPHYFMSSQHQ